MSGVVAVTVRAPAKVNLHLGVGAPRPDGFHPLVTVYHAIGLHDDVTVTDADDWSVSVTSLGQAPVDGVPTGADNLAVRAGLALAAHHGLDRAAKVHIAKGIPVAGGMAGGSADAAATLLALDLLWELRTSDTDLFALAAGLGSDVPFALVGGNALGTGRGEVVEQLPGADVLRWWVVLTSPGEGLSTPAVYRRYDELRPDAPAEPAAPHRLVAFLSDPTEVLAPLLHNDLQPAALDLRPELAEVLAAGEAAGALCGLVSGSGPTCVFLCVDAGSARTVAASLAEAYGPERVQVAPGATAGAHVVDYEA